MTLTVEVHLLVLCLTVTEQYVGILLLFLSSCEGKKKTGYKICANANMFMQHVEFS